MMEIVSKVNARDIRNLTKDIGNFVINYFKKIIADRNAQNIDFREYISEEESEYLYGKTRYSMRFNLREGKPYFNLRISPEKMHNGIERCVGESLPSNSQLEDDYFLGTYNLQREEDYIEIECRIKRVPQVYIKLSRHLWGRIIKLAMVGVEKATK